MKAHSRRKARLETVFSAVQTPVFVVDDRRRIVFFNTGCQRLTGWNADDLLGKTCQYTCEPDPDRPESITGALCPPPEVFSGSCVGVTADLPGRRGEMLKRRINYFALADEDGRVSSVLGIITPVQTEEVGPSTPTSELHGELAALCARLRRRFGVRSLVGQSEPMQRVLQQVAVARSSRAPLFIEGERGTGKEHVARVVHSCSEPGDGAFVLLDCRRTKAIDLKLTLRRLLDSGRDREQHVDGPGSPFEPKTLYLAYADCLPRDIQELLVPAFRSDGTAENEPGRPSSKLRLIASSEVDPHDALNADLMRSDFFHLVTPIHIKLPPLRRRMDDLRLLAQFMLEDLNRGDEKQLAGFAEDLWTKFREYSWPGNLDELRSVVAEARELCPGGVVQAPHLPFRFRAGLEAQAVGPKIASPARPLHDVLREVETEQIRSALDRSAHNKSKAARLLGMTRARLYRRMQALGIEDLEQDG